MPFCQTALVLVSSLGKKKPATRPPPKTESSKLQIDSICVVSVLCCVCCVSQGTKKDRNTVTMNLGTTLQLKTDRITKWVMYSSFDDYRWGNTSSSPILGHEIGQT